MERHFFDETLQTNLITNVLSNGLTCYIIPKEQYAGKEAVICVNYGACDESYVLDGRQCRSTEGTAHFLEHKLFGDESDNVFQKFTENGAYVNAFTSALNTAYYFNCIDNFYENLKLLLSFTSRLNLTKESVEKEKGIIAQEIKMYDDDAFWQMRLNLLKCMYKNSPAKNNISGSVKSVMSISKEMLETCFDTFYYPENMALICVGDVDAGTIYKIAEDNVKKQKPRDLRRVYGAEPAAVRRRKIEASMPLSRPMFSLGFKETDFTAPVAKRIVSTRIIMDVLAGASSDFYNAIYENGDIDGLLSLEYTGEKFFGYAVISGTCENPENTAEKILKEITAATKNGLNSGRFEQIKNKHIGKYIQSFNEIDSIAMRQTNLYNKSLSVIDYFNELKECDERQTNKQLTQLFQSGGNVLSIVKPDR